MRAGNSNQCKNGHEQDEANEHSDEDEECSDQFSDDKEDKLDDLTYRFEDSAHNCPGPLSSFFAEFCHAVFHLSHFLADVPLNITHCDRFAAHLQFLSCRLRLRNYNPQNDVEQ